MKLFPFLEEFGNPSTIVNVLRARRLLGPQPICDLCGDSMTEQGVNKTDCAMFYCRKRTCRKAKSLRYNSFFENAKLSLPECMLFLHLWAKDYPEKLIFDEFSFSNKTVVDWSRFCRELCAFHFESDMSIIGGPGRIVEIDETLAVKRKYNRGRVLAAGWLFGGIERRDDGQFNCFVRLVYDRSELHLTHLIQEHVAPGTHIMTDGWVAYRNLSSRGYTHSVVVHDDNFVSPADRQVHTQTIEATWSSLKRFIRSCGTHKGAYYMEYICEYVFRRKFPNVFDALLDVIRDKYPFSIE